MSDRNDELSPADFAATASRAIAACASLGVAEQGAQLAGDGLLGVIAADSVGGLDLPLSFAVPVVAAASAGQSLFPVMESLLLARLLQQRLPRVASAIVEGDQRATIAWQGAVAAERRGDAVMVSGCVARAPRAAEADWLLVRIGENAAALVSTRAPGVSIADGAGLDLAQPEHVVRFDATSIAQDSVLPDGVWQAMQFDALVLRAAAILGSAETCLALAQDHVSTRRQFGHALSYNQGIRHALARHKLGLEGIRQAIVRAMTPDASWRERRSAFLAACSYGVQISEGAVQLHGGMGFTWDVPAHRHVRRIRTLQAQGDASGLLAEQGHEFIASVPAAA